MDKLKNYLLATAGLLILAGAVQFVRPLQAEPLAKDVNVVNTAANPVPVVVQKGIIDIVEIIEDDIATGTTVPVFTVTAGQRLVITDMLASGVGAFTILRDGSPATIQFQGRGTNAGFMPITHAFATGIEFAAGEVVAISNDDDSNRVNVYLRGYTTTAP